MNEIKLTRTGQVPLAFTGEEIKTASSWRSSGNGQNRWHTITIYRTEASKRYVLAITYHTRWQGEEEQHDVLVLGPEQEQMIQALQEYNPIPEGIGYPRSDQYTERQASMERDLRRRFAALIVCDAAG